MSRLFLLLLRLVLWLLRKEAVRLNLSIDTHWLTEAWLAGWIGEPMAKIGDSFTARIAPTNASGNPAPVFNVVYGEEGDSYDVSVAPDGLFATFTARAAGFGNVAYVVATTKGGAELCESVSLPDVEVAVDEEAVALNLSIA